MYCLYVGFDYTYIDVNALAQGIQSFLASHVWSQAVAGARIYGTDSPAITSQPINNNNNNNNNNNITTTTKLIPHVIYYYACMYVCM